MDAIEELTDLKNQLAECLHLTESQGVLSASWDSVKCGVDLWVDSLTDQVVALVGEINLLYRQIAPWTGESRSVILYPHHGVWVKTMGRV